jgi:hypothetical protein
MDTIYNLVILYDLTPYSILLYTYINIAQHFCKDCTHIFSSVVIGGPLLHGITQGELALPLHPFGRVHGGIGRQHDHGVSGGLVGVKPKRAAICRCFPTK